MRPRILISDPDLVWAEKIKIFFHELSYDVDIALTGKDAQLNVYKNRYLAAILDFYTEDHSCLDVLKYFRLNAPSMKVILTMANEEVFKKTGLTDKEFTKLGITDLFIRPYELDKLKLSLDGHNYFLHWKNYQDKQLMVPNDSSVYADDEEFTCLKIDSFISGSFNIFDYYIRLSKGEYLKIFSRGEAFDLSRIEHYEKKESIIALYFKTTERRTYINFVNEILNKVAKVRSKPIESKLLLADNLVEKYIEEIHTVGLAPDLVIKGKEICVNINQLIIKDKNLSEILQEFKEHDFSSYGHLFLVTFFSIIIAAKLEWKSRTTLESLALGSMLHDLGKLKISKDILNLEKEEMNPEELKLYEKHPEFGLELLNNIPSIGESIRQIVYQHHELINGKGFPNRLYGTRIYPLAKVVSLSNFFSNLVSKHRVTAIEALKIFIPNKTLTEQYDPKTIKALVSCFINKEEEV